MAKRLQFGSNLKDKDSAPPKPGQVFSRILILVCCLFGLAMLVPIFFIGSFWIGCTRSEHRLNKGIAIQTEGLDELTVLSGQKIHSQGGRSGDCLTGSIGASTELPTTLNAGQAAAEVRRNLQRQDFKVKYPLEPTQSTADDSILDLRETYIKNDESQEVSITYNFTRSYDCNEVQQPCDAIYIAPVEALLQAPLRSVSVGYSNYDF